MAIAEAKKSKNIDLYLQLAEELSGIAPQDPAAFTDTTWAEKKAQDSQREQDRLEHELKSYKRWKKQFHLLSTQLLSERILP